MLTWFYRYIICVKEVYISFYVVKCVGVLISFIEYLLHIIKSIISFNPGNHSKVGTIFSPFYREETKVWGGWVTSLSRKLSRKHNRDSSPSSWDSQDGLLNNAGRWFTMVGSHHSGEEETKPKQIDTNQNQRQLFVWNVWSHVKIHRL
jgi:hypothetical protein